MTRLTKIAAGLSFCLAGVTAAGDDPGRAWSRLDPPRRLPPELVADAVPLVAEVGPSAGDVENRAAPARGEVVDAAAIDPRLTSEYAGLLASAEEPAGLGVSILGPGRSDRDARGDAARAMPLARLDRSRRGVVDDVMSKAGLFRSFPVVRSRVSPAVYELFATQPDVAVAIWRVMGIARCDVRQTGPRTYAIDAGVGGGGTMTILHRDAEHLLVHAVGTFSSPPLIHDVGSEAVVHVHIAAGGRDELGRSEVEAGGSLFVAFPSSAIDAVARVISPMTYRIIDQNFREVAVFIRLMDGTMRRRPDWVDAVASRMTGVTAAQATELRTVAYEVHRREPAVAFGQPPAESPSGRTGSAAEEFGFEAVEIGSAPPDKGRAVNVPPVVRTAEAPSPAPNRRTTRSRAGRRAGFRP